MESKIDTKLFAATAEKIKDIAAQMSNQCGEWNKATSSMRGVWQGDTSDNIKNTADQVQKSASALVAALQGYHKTLMELAGIYDNTEKNTQEAGKSLKFNQGSMR